MFVISIFILHSNSSHFIIFTLMFFLIEDSAYVLGFYLCY